MNREKFERLFTYFQNRLESAEKFVELSGFLLAICYVKLGDFTNAQQLFEKSCLAMFRPPKMWKISAQVSRLVDVWILSTRQSLYPTVLEELENYRKDMPKNNANSLLAQYSYGLVELLYPTGFNIPLWIQNLTVKPSIKDMFAIGQVFQAILDRDAIGLNSATENLLLSHQGKAKHGILRETPEGFICMSAMSLAYVAHKYDMKVIVTSEYFSPGYLNFMIEHAA